MSWYVPDDKETPKRNDGPHVAGAWPYRVHLVEETTSKAGNEMLRLEMFAETINGDARVYAYLVKTAKAAWKIKEFLISAGLDPKKPHDLSAFENATGVASFVVGERGYLEVEEFLPAGTKLSLDALVPKQTTVEDVPF